MVAYDFNKCKDFEIETVENETLKNILKDILSIKSLKDFHIETIDNVLYICLFELSQLNKSNIVKMLNNKGFKVNTFVTDCNYGMSYLPTTEIETEVYPCFNEELMIYDFDLLD